ncbi:MAG: antibiotic biosynthesis monooxygenase family protein [Pseudomonadota bacterium]|jgi:heme-degrading monooxygenase HmoA
MNPQKTAFVRSTLTVKSIPGQREALLTAFFKRRVLEECQETMPGFVSAEVLASLIDADEVQVSVLWRDQNAWKAWQDSPARLQQAHDLAPLLACTPQGQLYALAGNFIHQGC